MMIQIAKLRPLRLNLANSPRRWLKKVGKTEEEVVAYDREQLCHTVGPSPVGALGVLFDHDGFESELKSRENNLA
jgi:hypothetical protein